MSDEQEPRTVVINQSGSASEILGCIGCLCMPMIMFLVWGGTIVAWRWMWRVINGTY